MASTLEFIKLDGTAIRLSGCYLRQVPQEGGPPRQEFELVIILRGTSDHRTFLSMLSRSTLKVEIPDKSESGWKAFDTEVISSYASSTNSGIDSAFRHDVVLRETPASAERRAAAQPQPTPTTSPPAAPDTEPEPEPDEHPDAPADFSKVKVSGDASVWATAFRQMTNPSAKAAPPPEPPLEVSELAGAEAVLVSLRLEALIEQLAAAGIVRRLSVNASFMRLVQQRFVDEATPVIGERAALQAARAAMEE